MNDTLAHLATEYLESPQDFQDSLVAQVSSRISWNDIADSMIEVNKVLFPSA